MMNEVLRHFPDWSNDLIASQIDSMTIKANPHRPALRHDSKFGGFASLPVDTQYPTNRDGVPMQLVAQINFAQLPNNDIYPGKGLLQFFVSTDDFYGKSLDHPRSSDFKLLFHENLDGVWRDWQNQLNVDDDEVCRPIVDEYAIDFVASKSFPVPGDIRSKRLISPSMFEIDGIYDSQRHALYARGVKTAHQLGGYVFFIQYDPRERYPEYHDFVILLQLDSDQYIQWGDCGSAHLLIHPRDLEQKDFSKVVYHWSCF